ncbi:MAG: 4Fe-4S dicluster domain-containing protein [Planctomycetaceae bacterium]|nr:4Fe-4S dicluster domain-containing protein [Planctomycetaceae bacterium]
MRAIIVDGRRGFRQGERRCQPIRRASVLACSDTPASHPPVRSYFASWATSGTHVLRRTASSPAIDYNFVMPRQILPQIDARRCTLCGDCLRACPTECLAIAPHSRIVVAPQLCISCTVCEAVCPAAAIAMQSQAW